MAGQEHRRLQQCVQSLVEVGVLQPVPRDEEEEGGEGGNGAGTSTVIGAGKEIAASTMKMQRVARLGYGYQALHQAGGD